MINGTILSFQNLKLNQEKRSRAWYLKGANFKANVSTMIVCSNKEIFTAFKSMESWERLFIGNSAALHIKMVLKIEK